MSVLAEEVRSGQLSGICHFSPVSGSGSDAGSGDAPQAGAHCNLCASLGWVFPPLAVRAIPCFAGEQVASANFPADTCAAIPGLQFSRGPPSALN